MLYTQGIYPVISKKKITETIYDFTISAKEIADIAKPGQFVQVKVDGFMLRRPISLAGIENGNIRLIFEVKGEGTASLANIKEGDSLDILGPLGHGFTMLPKDKKVILIGGGIGTPPMVPLAKYYDNAKAIIGFRSAENVILKEEFKDVTVCTNDGSEGVKGFVTDALINILEIEKPDMIYACGPNVMLEGIAKIANEKNIECEVSLEERMACGVGACLGCACKTKSHDGTSSHAHVCKDGPVFNSKEVIF